MYGLLKIVAMACAVSAARHNQKTQVALRAQRALVTDTYYGSNLCPCVGLDNLKGEIEVYPDAKTTAHYPAELGSSCMAWDLNYYPKSCNTGQDDDYVRNKTYEPWCYKKWCYVDPCNCKIPQPPKVSSYLPDATYQGKPIYYSYETCGAADAFTAKEHKAACVNQKSEAACGALPKCAWSGTSCVGKEVLGMCDKKDEAVLGNAACQCIGIDGYVGEVQVDTGKHGLMNYPASTGSKCEAWDAGRAPDCKSANPPSWCAAKWCYVDPCKCKLEEPPKVSAYLPDVKYQGRPVYYSYATCGAEDTYTAKHHKMACVNQKSAQACNALPKCSWTGKECLGKDLREVCYGPVHEIKSGAWIAQPAALLALFAILSM